MQVYIKETLYVLDYDNNIVDMIFTSDDHRTPGYAYNINIEESNTGYSNLTFSMPTKILPMPNDLDKAPTPEEFILNPKLELLTPLVKLRYNRQVFYVGQETIMVQEPVGYGDTTTYIEKEYNTNDIMEDYVMDYIVQPLDKKRSGHEVSLNFTAMDYPRFNLSKKRFGLTINEDTITRDDWSLFKSEPMSIAGSVQYIQWTQDMSNQYQGENHIIPTSWDPTTATDYPINIAQLNNMMGVKEVWPYGVTATVYWWPITNTGRFEGIMYNEGDYLTLQLYPKMETGTADTSTITHNLDLYGYQWTYLEKGKSFLTPNNPTNYLNWILENTNWQIALKEKEPVGWTVISDDLETDEEILPHLPTKDTQGVNLQEGDYWLFKTLNVLNTNYLHYAAEGEEPVYSITQSFEELPVLTTEDIGTWECVILTEEYEIRKAKYVLPVVSICSWDGNKWYVDYADRECMTTRIYQWKNNEWINVSNDYHTSNIDKRVGFVYDIDIVETEVAKPEGSVGDLFETTDLRTNLNLSDSNCYNAITALSKAFQLYPVFNCEDRTVSLKLFAGKNYGLTYRLGQSLEGTSVKEDGDKIITKLYSYGGQDTKGTENINLGDAERSYQKLLTGFYKNKDELPLETIEGEIAIVDPSLQEEYWLASEDRVVYFYRDNEWTKGVQNEDGSWSDSTGILNIDPESGSSFPWDPNAPDYIQKRSPYGTNYIYNFKWMYDNEWITKGQILKLYDLSEKIQELNKKVLKPLTEDFLATNDAYVDAGVQLSTDQDEYMAVLNSMMNTYYRHPGETTDKFTAFPEKPADCYVGNDGRCYFDIHYCDKCHATRGISFPNNVCTTVGCDGELKIRTIHINTWEEESNGMLGLGTTSERWNPTSKGFYQEVYEQLGEDNKDYIYLGQIFEERNIDNLNNEKKYVLNDGKEPETIVYDKSAHLYHWNDCVNKWIEHFGYSIKDEKEVNALRIKVELLEESQKVYNRDLADLEDQIQDKFGDYIIEGKFHDEEIVYPAILLVKTLEASDQYAVPDTTYNLNVIDSSGLIEYRMPGTEIYNELVHSLHSIGQIVPKAGDYVTIYDEPIGMYGVPGLITTIRRVLDNPQSNSITVNTSYTDNEELVGNIITATNTVLSNKDIYARTAILKSDGTVSGAAMAKTLEENSNKNLTFVGVSGSTLLDSSGLLVTNPNKPERKMKYTGAGVFGTVDNGMTYDAMMTPEGINANYINAGSIDTQKIQIMSGLHGKVVLDNYGLAVKDNKSLKYTLPTKTKKLEEETFLDWSDSNLKAFIGVDGNNDAQLYLKGQMQIDGGSIIGGWNVLGNKLFSTNGQVELTSAEKDKGIQNYVGLSSDGQYAFWTGNSDPEKANFRIKHNGELVSETMNAKIKVTDDKIVAEVKDRKDADAGLSSRIAQTYNSISLNVGNKDKAGSISISMTKDNGETSTSTGLISSIVLTADKVELNGGINKIGGWVIKDGYLGNMAGTQDGSAASSNYFLSQNGQYAWCSMNGDATDHFFLFFKDRFAVTTAGKLYCKNASFSGSISGSSISSSTFSLNDVTIKTCTIKGYPVGVEGTGSNFEDTGIAIGSTFIGQKGYSGALYKKGGGTYIVFFLSQKISSMEYSKDGVITSVTAGISIPTIDTGGGGSSDII